MTTMTDDPVATAPTRQPLDGAVQIPTALLVPSPTNPRKHFDADRVTQIAESMLSVGQIQPIRVRPNPLHTASNGRPAYEIVVGETRWRAACQAGLPLIDAVVREYTDFEVIEIQLIENLQRSDLHPMEEAAGYEQLLRREGGLQGYASVQELAARVGRSTSYVYQRIKLLALCPAGREAFYAGKLSASVAQLVARMHDQAEQAKATATLAAGWAGEPYSFRNAAELLQREYMLSLAKAPFIITATYGVAGPCHECPKRSGAAPDLFADVTSGDMCQDSRCYQAKAEEEKQATLQRNLSAVTQSPAHGSTHGAPAAAPAAPAPEPARKAGDPVWPEPKKADPRSQAAPARRGGEGATEEDKAAASKVKLETATRRRYGAMLFGDLHAAVGKADLKVEALRAVVGQLFADCTFEAAKMIYTARGWWSDDELIIGIDRDFGDRLADLTPRELGELLIELALAENLSNENLLLHRLEPCTLGVLKAYGVNPERMWAQAETAAQRELADEAKAKDEQAAGDARRKLSPTDAFIEQHGSFEHLKPAAAPKTNRPPVKYRCPMTGQTWTGRGLQPTWLKAALARGGTLADFINPAAPAASGTTSTDAPAGGVDQMDEGDE
jgi:ParB/RepB/Spo0J family partition protein